jgi:hypothetical protein
MSKEQMPSQAEGAEDDRMELEEAQGEANMMRVQFEEALGHAPTAEDYDNALKAVEEIKEEAAKESDVDKVLFGATRIIDKYFINASATAILKVLSAGKYPWNEQQKKNDEERGHGFDDAAEKLRQLKKEAGKFEQ